mmetsp:Transcript_100555/g.300046  ORF Transcript_100555/g.300046 Transcript_100555/m.300046 type:complete len:132 (-) Transcript_100555:410-805(-)
MLGARGGTVDPAGLSSEHEASCWPLLGVPSEAKAVRSDGWLREVSSGSGESVRYGAENCVDSATVEAVDAAGSSNAAGASVWYFASPMRLNVNPDETTSSGSHRWYSSESWKKFLNEYVSTAVGLLASPEM